MSLFDSTYICKHIFSQMKIVKSKNRAQLTNIHLENLLKIASFQIQPNIKKNTLLVKNNVNYHTKNKINDF